jgi:hypothetical protein
MRALSVFELRRPQRCRVAGKRDGQTLHPINQFWLTVDACAAYRFPHSAALHVQMRLGNMKFTTEVEGGWK